MPSSCYFLNVSCQEEKYREEIRSLVENISGLQQKIEALGAVQEAQSAEFLARSAAEKQAHEKEMKALARKLEEKENSIAALHQEKIDLMKESSSSRAKFSEEIKRLENETIKKLHEKVADFSNRLQTQAEELERAADRCALLDKARDEMRLTAEATAQQLAKADAELASARRQASELESKQAVLEAAHQALQRKEELAAVQHAAELRQMVRRTPSDQPLFETYLASSVAGGISSR